MGAVGGVERASGAAWSVAGTYFEACNCLAICPCRQVGGRDGSRSTYGVCDFALSWHIVGGRVGRLDVGGRDVVMVGTYDDDEPDSPWTVGLFVDEHASEEERDALADVFLGRAGGTPARNYAGAISAVTEVRAASVRLDHAKDRWSIRVEDLIDVTADRGVESTETVACGIPGLDHPGQEVQSRTLRVNAPPLVWEWNDRCGFATDFAYRSD